MEFFVGIDVSLGSTSICVVDERGVVIKEGKCPREPETIARFIRLKGRRIEHVGLETGSLSQWLHAGLTRKGFRVTVMEARHVRASLATMCVKTDCNDALGIAQLVRLGLRTAGHDGNRRSHLREGGRHHEPQPLRPTRGERRGPAELILHLTSLPVRATAQRPSPLVKASAPSAGPPLGAWRCDSRDVL